MQAFTQKYTIIQLFEEASEGTQFASTNWPLHVTVVDTFATSWNVPTILKKLEQLLGSYPQVTSVAEDDTFFGLEKQTHVVLLKKTDSLVRLHYDVIALLEEGSLKLNDPQFAREGFLPHVTVQKHARLHKGDHVTFSALPLIDMFPDGNPYQRKVLKTIKLARVEPLL